MRRQVLWVVVVLLGSCVRAGLKAETQQDSGSESDVLFSNDTKVAVFESNQLWPDSNQGHGTVLRQKAVELETIRSFAVKQASLTKPVAWATAAAVKDTVYLFGGALTQSDAKTNPRSDAISKYVPAKDALSSAGNLAKGLSMSAAVAVDDDAIYLVKGYDPDASGDYAHEKKIQRYDIEHGSLTTLGVTLISANRHAAVLSDDRIYIYGGYGTGPIRHEVQSVYVDDAPPSVKDVAANLLALGGRTFLAACAMPNGNIYLFGGDLKESPQPGDALDPVDEILLVKPGSTEIEKVGRLPMRLKGMAAGLLPDGNIVLVGGDTLPAEGSARSDRAIVFDPTTNQAELLPEKLPYPLTGAAHAVQNGKLYLLGGLTDSGLSDKILEYLPYADDGIVEGETVDSEVVGTKWRELSWEANVPSGTTLALDVRASDSAMSEDNPPWQPVDSSSPVTSGLPSGRNFQWRARLGTSNGSVSPKLTSVAVSY